MSVCTKCLLWPSAAPDVTWWHLLQLQGYFSTFWLGTSLMLQPGQEGRLLADTRSCQPRHARTLIHKATHPRWGGKWGISAALLGCILHSSYEHPGRTEPRMDYGLAALTFCFILSTLPLLFLGILSQNKYLWERPYVKVYFPFESQAKTLGTWVSALEQWR